MNKYQINRILEKIFNIKICSEKQNTNDTNLLILNEAVNFEKEIIFIAIPKTGTTTVRTQIKQTGIPLIGNSHLDICQIQDLIYIYLLKENLGKNRNFPTRNIANDADLRLKSKKIFDTFFKFSAVRNPWARAVSLYSRKGVKLMENISFEEFCKNHFYASDTCLHPTIHKNQLDWLTSNSGQILMDYIYKVEEFEKAIDEIKERTNGRLILDNIKLNVNPNSKSNNYRDIYNYETRKIIEKRFEKDIDYFKYTF